ncbi:CCD27 protein, partial [Turnix velox]|nr:CCD27 protein [Turnix velox]
TGTISSLQRQLEIQGSQLRRVTSEKETLLRKMREQENQLQALSTKICSLVEEERPEEMLMAMEKENMSLKEVVTEQESKLVEQKELINELEGTIRQLRMEVVSNQKHIQKQQEEQEELQNQAEELQHKELQTRVELESITSRFERYRSKIIQAAFNATGIKPPQTELTDEEVLETMQKIINERMEFHQLLKQKGIK